MCSSAVQIQPGRRKQHEFSSTLFAQSDVLLPPSLRTVARFMKSTAVFEQCNGHPLKAFLKL
jgi:hypothetical protein